MQDRELDLNVARALGYRHYRGKDIPEDYRHISEVEVEQQEVWVLPDGHSRGGYLCSLCDGLPWFSSDIKDAWEVVEYLARIGLSVDLRYEQSGTSEGTWECCVWKQGSRTPLIAAASQEKTAPLAICSALLAIKKDIDEYLSHV